MTTNQFWRAQSFSYILTHSFNRGAKLDALLHAANQQFAEVRKELLTAPTEWLPAMRENLRSLERGRNLTLLPLTEELKTFQITASPVAKTVAETPEAACLVVILAASVSEQDHWMCAPVYRDALAFYNSQGTLCAVLNICFGCDKMISDQQQEIAADTSTYQKLKIFLIELGHKIAEN